MKSAPPLHRRLDRYELIAEIASGGMGSVLLARLGGAGGFERLFAIKVMHPELMQSPQFVEMLLDEARVAAKIHHPNVVATVDVREHDDFYYIVMDYVDGFPLARILDAGPFERRERVRIVNRLLLDAMSGLSAAHNLCGDDGVPLGIVHRDVSPQNILIGTDGVGRLTDFGIALAARRYGSGGSEAIKGKPSYLAPEQASEGEVDLRADLWGLGVILWEALTGVRLFSASTESATIVKVVSEPIVSPAVYHPDVPPDLEALCLRALDRDPSRRHRSAREMALELERVAARSGLLADTHEVADLLRSRLGPEIEARRRAIQRSVAELAAPSLPATSADVHSLPKLSELAPSSGPSGQMRQEVGLATMPASRFLRTTPAGTASETPPAKPRRMLGVLSLLALFGLGSFTTLTLLRFRVLDQAMPTLRGTVPSLEAAPDPVDLPEPVAASTPAPSAAEIAPPASPQAGAPESSPPLETVAAVPPKPIEVRKAPVQRVNSSAVSSSPRARRVAVPDAENAAPQLPIEENPYRLK